MRALVVLSLALAPLLAGCVLPNVSEADTVPDVASALAKLACFDHDNATVCNMEATTTNERGNEVTVAVNPLDPLNIVAGAKDYTEEHTGGQCVWDGVYVTKDGGKTWLNYNVPGSPWLLVTNREKFEMSPSSGYWCATDPVVRFGPDGTLYYSVMNYQGDPVTASKLLKDQTCSMPGQPIGCTGVNDFAFNRVAQLVYVSTDGGESFDYGTVIDMGTFPVNFHDRQWMDVGPDGTVYVAWTSGLALGNMLYRSTDRAKTWEGPVWLDGTPLGIPVAIAKELGAPLPWQGFTAGSMFVAAGPAGTVYVSGEGAEGAYLTKSTDGGATFSEWTHVACEVDEGMEATYRGGGVARVVASQTTDRIAMVCVDTRNGDRDVFVRVSEDGGATWGEEARVNDDEIGSGKDQFMATIAISPSGILDAVWYDRRLDSENYLLDIFHSRSTDGGKTWSENLRITEVASDPQHSIHQGGFVFMGDYIDIGSTDVAAVPVWVDTRMETADVFVASILQAGQALDFAAGTELGAEHEH